MMRVGLLGMRRRIGDYDPALGFDPWQLAMTISAFAIALAVLIFFYNIYTTLKSGEMTPGNIWKSRSPEWQVPSPMPAHNYDHEIEVVGEPYDYGLPGSVYVKILSEE
jgi:cytochrome c oxidase subunit 1